ncbi:hypothetical protein HY771_00320 [Candidatus Uhrbacteria bacterium]|nr:hypothetical protein [Candidatus Uhrbacteria bacterium]MBI4812252.1 hypothetical protein [Candidatus Falkowbacteria bacterium]
MLSISIITALFTISMPIYQAFQERNELDIATTSVAQSLRRAQIIAQAVDADTSWGVKIQTSTITLFKGTSFATRDSAYDEEFSFPSNIVPSGVYEVVFAKWTGIPATTGTITFTSSINEIRNLTINSKGTVSY